MSIALVHAFSPDRKEPLATLLERIHGAFAASGLEAPAIDFTFADQGGAESVSGVDRVLKRHPELGQFLAVDAPIPGGLVHRRLTNARGTPSGGVGVDFATLHAIAAGVPKSYPFGTALFHLKSAAFGADGLSIAGPPGSSAVAPGVLVSDGWWIKGRLRSLAAVTVVGADPNGKPLPLPPAIAAILAACGKVTGTTQLPIEGSGEGGTLRPAAPAPEIARAVAAIVDDFRNRFDEVLERARLPHDLPSPLEALESTPLGASAGSKKPVLVRAFKPLGYDCRHESGEYTLGRRSRGDFTVTISLDVGTWGRTLHASYAVSGPGFRVSLPLAVVRGMRPDSGYKIGDAARWQQIVDNLTALVAELDRSFVPAVEAAAGASPDRR